MKKVLISLFFIVVSYPLIGQSKNQLNDLITECLHLFIEYDSDLQNKTDNNNVIYICKDGLPLDFPYNLFPDYSFFSLEYNQYNSNVCKKSFQNEVSSYFVCYELMNNQISIIVSKRSIKTFNRKRMEVGISDWGKYLFVFSCSTSEWQLMNTQYGGV